MTYRNRKLLDIAHGAPCFLRIEHVCRSGVNPSVPCHSNLQRHGRGLGHKSHDIYAVPGCVECHFELDAGKSLSRERRDEIFMRAFERYMLWLFESEKVRVT